MILPRRFLPDMKVLQTFEFAARHGNFTHAAGELSLTQSAVSRHIRELEAQTGKQLFERLRGGKVVLTRDGRELLPKVQRLLREADITMRQSAAGGAGRRVLAVNVLPTFAARWLVPRLPDFMAGNTELRVDVTTVRGTFDFQERQIDLAIHYGPPHWPGATCRFLSSEQIVPVAGGALAEAEIAAPAEIAALPRIHLTTRQQLWTDWFQEQGLTCDQADEGNWFDDLSLIIEATKAGMGVALLPLFMIERELAGGELRVVLDRPYVTDTAYYIVTPEGTTSDVADFIDWLIAQAEQQPRAAD